MSSFCHLDKASPSPSVFVVCATSRCDIADDAVRLYSRMRAARSDFVIGHAAPEHRTDGSRDVIVWSRVNGG